MVLIISLLTLSFSANIQEVLVTCNACHGQNGISVNPLWPNLANQHHAYLVKQLKDYRDGLRNDPLMSPLSKNLSDAEIDALATYYSNLSGEPSAEGDGAQ